MAATAFFAVCAFTQTPQSEAQQPGGMQIDTSNPRQVVANLDGAPVTAEEFQFLVVAIDQKVRDSMNGNAESLLRYVGWLRRMTAEAEKMSLHEKPDMKRQLEMVRIQLLSNAMIQQHELDEVVTPFDQQGYYQANKELFSGVKVKLIYIPFSGETEELQAKRKMEDVHKKLKAGANFVDLVKEYSRHDESKAKDGDYGEVRKTDQIPQAVKDVAFGLKDGEFSGPTRLPNGYYIFQRTGLNTDPYEKVRDEIFTAIKQKRNLDWVSTQRAAVKVEILPDGKTTDPNRIIGRLEGKPVTAAERDGYLSVMDEKLRANLRENSEDLLRGIGYMRRLTEMAVQQRIPERGPYRQQLEINRAQALSNALIQAKEASLTISDAEIQKAYEENRKYVSTAKVKLIYVAAGEGGDAAMNAARQLAEEISIKIKEGADFVEMVKQYSKDPVSRDKAGDYGPLKITDDFPAPAKKAIWELSPGQVSNPVKLPNGYYIFKAMHFEEPGAAAVKDDLARRLRIAQAREWLNGLRSQVQVQILAPAASAPK